MSEPPIILLPGRRPRIVLRPLVRRMIASAALLALFYMVFIGVSPLQEAVVSPGGGEGDNLREIFFGVIFSALFLGSLAFGDPRRMAVFPVAITIMLAYCSVSVLWALAPGIAIRRLILTAMTMWILFRCVDELGHERILRLVRIAMVVFLIINYVVLLVSPYGVHTFSTLEDGNLVGAWRGIMSHKNLAGEASAYTVLIFMFDARRVSMLVRWPVVVAAAIFLIGSQSKTSGGLVILSILTGWAGLSYDPRMRALIAPVTIIILALGLQLADLNSTIVLAPFADPNGWTGRMKIWSILIQYSRDHFLTGAGFGSFWQIGPNGPIFQYSNDWVAKFTGHGHNGYLDLLVTIGFPGLLLAVVTLILWPLSRTLLNLSLARSRRALALALMTFCICHNMTESSLLDRASATQVFMMLTIALIYSQPWSGRGLRKRWRERALRVLGFAPADPPADNVSEASRPEPQRHEKPA